MEINSRADQASPFLNTWHKTSVNFRLGFLYAAAPLGVGRVLGPLAGWDGDDGAVAVEVLACYIKLQSFLSVFQICLGTIVRRSRTII